MTGLITREMDALVQFRSKVEEELDLKEKVEDDFLLRWLRARDFNVDKALEMLTKSIEWRKVNLDTINEITFPEAITNDFKFRILGVDYEGSPVILLPIGRYNLRDLLKTEEGYGDLCVKYGFYVIEELMSALKEQRDKCGATKIVILVDMEEINFYKVAHYETLQLCFGFMSTFEANYPEILKAAYVFHVSWVFHYVYNLAKPFIHKNTLSKITLLGKDKSKWGKTISGLIPSEHIPTDYGGSGPAFYA